MRYSKGRLALLLGGCVVLGVGVGLLLAADLGSDGFSTLVNGTSLGFGISFWTASLVVGIAFISLAAIRGVRPGLGTVVQVVVVGITVSVLLDALATPHSTVAQIGLIAAAFPVLSLGITMYLGTHTGAGPPEALALSWDPPLPFRWSYSLVQGGSALVGWLLGATIGPGTILVIVLLGPMVAVTSRSIRLDVHQPRGPAEDHPEAGDTC